MSIHISKDNRYYPDLEKKLIYLVEKINPPKECKQIGKPYIIRTAINLLYHTVKLEEERLQKNMRKRVDEL